MTEPEPHPTVRRRLFRVAHLAAVLPSHHSCLSETESRSPSPWSAGRLQLPVCPRLFASSFRRSSPKTPLRQKNPPLPSRPREKMVAAVCPRYFCCGIRTELIRQIPIQDCIITNEWGHGGGGPGPRYDSPTALLISNLFHTIFLPILWAQEDLLKLLDSMKVALPQKDLTKYKTSESHLDWQKVAFNSYTAEMCKQKWQEVSKEIRKFRTLTELIFDAQDYIKNPYKGKKLKKHPDFPKKPLTPYFRFFMEKRAKYAKLHPEMSNLDLTKILSKKYRELPDKKKFWAFSY
ncbi:hypothetical protein CCH79_00008326 [Gambusia affinis]|uniref:HMG box domain-containing protein n=1 Tax=Gambusia affinis TaxID=33528 RepID=A0A315V366_GAMAF|nr:hypothetical protein CCH79_00008326 [Gambusia affinis]